jgi:uncharacterized protein
LARVARWNGQTIGDHAFSVAQHSLIVTDIFESLNPNATRSEVMAALLHDAPEYVVGDLISPFKAALSLDYKAFELRLLDAIHARFSVGAISDDCFAAIKSADRIAAFYEATRLAGFSIDEAREFFGWPAIDPTLTESLESLSPLPANDAQKYYLARFTGIGLARN